MSVEISCTQEERNKVLVAVSALNDNKVVKHMSYDMLSQATDLSVSKVRLVLEELLADKVLYRTVVNKGSRVPRYYYFVTPL